MIPAVQSWSLRGLDFRSMIGIVRSCGLAEVQCAPPHCSPEETESSLREKLNMLHGEGVRFYAHGVTAPDGIDEVRRLCVFARTMEIGLLVVEPGEFGTFDLLEHCAAEFDLHIALHNHGLRTLYGNPLVVERVLRGRSDRMGVCLDAGWLTSSRIDAAETARTHGARLLDVHLKDMTATPGPDGDIVEETDIGAGGLNVPSFLSTLESIGYHGRVALETDLLLDDPQAWLRKGLAIVKKQL